MIKTEKTLEQLTSYSRLFLNIPYIWGGNSFLKGLDCSGFLQHLLFFLGIYDLQDRTVKGIKRYLLSIGGHLTYHKRKGHVLFYGPEFGKEEHISFAFSDSEVIESGGGGSTTKTIEEAKRRNAKVRIKSINHRDDFLYSIPISFKEIKMEGKMGKIVTMLLGIISMMVPQFKKEDSKVGVKESKEMLKGLNALSVLLIQKFKDGVQFNDFMELYAHLKNDPEFEKVMKEAYEGYKKIPSEFEDIDAGESLELVAVQVESVPKIIDAVKA